MYRAFREFLDRSPDLHLDRVRQFAFERPILDKVIRPAVLELLQDPSPQDYALILAGQSGSGKTMMMSLLAVDLREAGVPVVFIRRGVVPPDLSQLDRFGAKLEAVAKIPFVVLYDGLLPDYEYLKVAQFLSGRGRKAVVVGTTYRPTPEGPPLEKEPEGLTRRERRGRERENLEWRRRTRTIAIPIQMTPEEREALIRHLSQFLPHERETLERLALGGYGNFFAVLYHLLEPARDRLRDNLVREIEVSVSEMDRAVEQHQREEWEQRNRVATTIEVAIREALVRIVAPPLAAADEAAGDADRQARSAGYAVIKLVMLASRYNLDTPQSIALGLLRAHNFDLYRHIFDWCKVLEDREPAPGVYTLRARQALEAQLWCDKMIPQDEDRFRIIRNLVVGLDPRLLRLVNVDDRSPEHAFVVRLLRTIGPSGPDGLRLPGKYFQQIAQIVQELQKRSRVIHPRLLLIQSNSAREAVQFEQKQSDLVGKADGTTGQVGERVQAWLDNLRRAEEVLHQAQEAVESQLAPGQVSLPPGARQLLSVVETERACILGVQQGCLARVIDHDEARLGWLHAQRVRPDAQGQRASRRGSCDGPRRGPLPGNGRLPRAGAAGLAEVVGNRREQSPGARHRLVDPPRPVPSRRPRRRPPRRAGRRVERGARCVLRPRPLG